MKLETISDKGHQLNLEAAKDWRSLVEAAGAAGFDIDLNTAYRTREHQERLFKQYLKDVATWERNKRLGPKPSPVARPGTSSHETGSAVDIQVAKNPKLLAWLRANASRYNFYETVKTEPWHWEFRP